MSVDAVELLVPSEELKLNESGKLDDTPELDDMAELENIPELVVFRNMPVEFPNLLFVELPSSEEALTKLVTV